MLSNPICHIHLYLKISGLGLIGLGEVLGLESLDLVAVGSVVCRMDVQGSMAGGGGRGSRGGLSSTGSLSPMGGRSGNSSRSLLSSAASFSSSRSMGGRGGEGARSPLSPPPDGRPTPPSLPPEDPD